jgi:hypothetical protein
LPLISLEIIVQVFVGEDRKSRSSDYFFVLASLSIHRFDLALYDIISILHVLFSFFKNNNNNNDNLGRICSIFYFSLGISDIACVFA